MQGHCSQTTSSREKCTLHMIGAAAHCYFWYCISVKIQALQREILIIEWSDTNLGRLLY